MSNYIALQKLMASFKLGLFFNLSADDEKIPNSVARLLDVDDEGYCWFLFHFSADQANGCEKEFPARVRLYEKGRDCYVEISGKAEHLSEPGEWTKCSKISYGMAKALQFHGLVIRLKFNQVVVCELGWSSRRNRVQKILDGLDEWVTGKRITETIYQSVIASH